MGNAISSSERCMAEGNVLGMQWLEPYVKRMVLTRSEGSLPTILGPLSRLSVCKAVNPSSTATGLVLPSTYTLLF